MSQLILVFVLQTTNTSASIKLSTKNGISLAETIKFSCKVMVLALQNVRMFLESFFLSEEISVASSVLRLNAPLVLDFTAASIKGFLALLKSEFSVAKLDRQVGISSFSKLNVFAGFKVVGLLAFTVS